MWCVYMSRSIFIYYVSHAEAIQELFLVSYSLLSPAHIEFMLNKVEKYTNLCFINNLDDSFVNYNTLYDFFI